MLDRAWAREFARDWIDAWNSHDLDRILSHYSEDFEMSSPLIVERMGLSSGKLAGKSHVAEYWRPSMALSPPLSFELIDVLVGVDQLTIYYSNSGRRVVAETLTFDASLKATKGCSQWSARDPQ